MRDVPVQRTEETAEPSLAANDGQADAASDAKSSESFGPTGRAQVTGVDVIVGLIGVEVMVGCIVWLVAFPPSSRVNTAGLVGLFLVAAAAVVVATRARWMRWKLSRVIGGALAAAAGATVLLLTVLQILPAGSRGLPEVAGPAGSGSTSVSSTGQDSPEPRASPSPSSTRQESREVARCIQMVRGLWNSTDASPDGAPPPRDDLAGRVWATSTVATTVVVADSVRTWTCNLEPDLAVSTAGRAAIGHDADSRDFSIAYWYDSDETITGGAAEPYPQAQSR